MKTYKGVRHGYVAEVTVDGESLDPRLDLWNHSPTGFEWGYAGSGPAQLALALLADVLGDEEKAVNLHQEFKSSIVAGLPYNGWTLTEAEIRTRVASVQT